MRFALSVLFLPCLTSWFHFVVVTLECPRVFRGRRGGDWFHAFSVVIAAIQRLEHLKGGPMSPLISSDTLRVCFTNSSGRMWRGQDALSQHPPPLLLFLLWSYPVAVFSIQSSTLSSKWGSCWHLQSARVCRMVVACKVSLKQRLNFWTCHLVFLSCNRMWTPSFFYKLKMESGRWTLCELFSLTQIPLDSHIHTHAFCHPLTHVILLYW